MSRAEQFQSFDEVSEIYRAIGTVIGDYQLYTADHPRYSETVEKLLELLQTYFEENPEKLQLTYVIRRGQPEYQRIPLLEAGGPGTRFTELLEKIEAAGFQLRRETSSDDIRQLVQAVLGKAPSQATDQPFDPTAITLSPDESQQSFRFITESGVKSLRSGGGSVEDCGLYSALPELLVSESSVRSLFDSFRSLMGSLENGDEPDLGRVRGATDQALDFLAQGETFTGSRVSTGYFDDFTFHHSINVCLLTTQVLSNVSPDRDLVRRISLAALLHDVGKSRIPVDILRKPSRLTEAEFECMKTHPIIGADILLGVHGIDPLCVQVAFGHHVHDGPGSYPVTRTGVQLDWVTELISAIDIYEALTAVRPYKSGMPSERAFQVMASMPGLKTRLNLVKLIYDCVGPYPAGSVVELNTKQRAIVVGRTPDQPRRPRVRLLRDASGLRLEENVELDLSDPEVAEKLYITATVVCRESGEDPVEAEVHASESSEFDHDDAELMAREG
ncbi:MAG: HD domain-containing phosphohydrolase [Planctomycetota bacterium]